MNSVPEIWGKYRPANKQLLINQRSEMHLYTHTCNSCKSIILCFKSLLRKSEWLGSSTCDFLIDDLGRSLCWAMGQLSCLVISQLTRQLAGLRLGHISTSIFVTSSNTFCTQVYFQKKVHTQAIFRNNKKQGVGVLTFVPLQPSVLQ